MKIIGYSKDYYLNGKYIGSVNCKKDRNTFGYYGRIEDIIENDIIFRNKKRLKKGVKVITELQQLNGKI